MKQAASVDKRTVLAKQEESPFLKMLRLVLVCAVLLVSLSPDLAEGQEDLTTPPPPPPVATRTFGRSGNF